MFVADQHENNLVFVPNTFFNFDTIRQPGDDKDWNESFETFICHSVTKRRRQTMKSILCLSLLILLMPSAYAAELPGDSAEGSFLHDANCLGCHDTGVYTRKDRRIRSLDALKGQLASCSHMANQQFSAIEMQNIIKYLNDQFYQFR